MENQVLFETLLKEVKDDLNFKEVQQLKSQDKANEVLIEHKIQKLEKQKKINRFYLISLLILLVALSFILQANILWSYKHVITILIPWVAISVPMLFYTRKSIPKTLKSLLVFKLMDTINKQQEKQ
jgi:C4-dicarboxylate transporter